MKTKLQFLDVRKKTQKKFMVYDQGLERAL
jgi:hypothetical protein